MHFKSAKVEHRLLIVKSTKTYILYSCLGGALLGQGRGMLNNLGSQGMGMLNNLQGQGMGMLNNLKGLLE